jgi:hypothetical protein
MCAGGALLKPADVEGARSEVDLVPTQVGQFGCAEAVPVGHQDHGRIPVTVAIFLGGIHELFNFGFSQIFAGTQGGVGEPPWCNCS